MVNALLTPDLWRETVFTKSPNEGTYQLFSQEPETDWSPASRGQAVLKKLIYLLDHRNQK